MEYYFFSPTPCVLSYQNFTTVLNYTPQKLHVKTHTPLTFTPIYFNHKRLPISCFINNLPQEIICVKNKNFAFCYPEKFEAFPQGYKVFLEHNTKNINLVLFTDNDTKLVIYGQNAFVYKLPKLLQSASVLFFDEKTTVLSLQYEKQLLLVINNLNMQTQLKYIADEFTLTNGQIVGKTVLPTVARHVIKTTLNYPFLQATDTVERTATPNKNNPLVFKLDFLQSVNAKSDLSLFLADNLKEQADKLKSFLPSFKHVVFSPLPDFDFCLIGKSLTFIKLNLVNGKIADILTE